MLLLRRLVHIVLAALCCCTTGTLKIKHAARWHNEPRSQAEWETWGYWLHGHGNVLV